MLSGAFWSFWSSASQSSPKSEASGSGTKKEESRSAQASSQQGGLSSSKHEQSSKPALKRSNSLPTRLPSRPHQPEAVKTARQSITRPMPDTKPPVDFEAFAEEKGEGATLKRRAMTVAQMEGRYEKWLDEKRNERSPEYLDFLKSVHPKYYDYTLRQQENAFIGMAQTHPKILAEEGNKLNEWYALPSHATSSRMMEPKEQKCLTKAMLRIREDAEQNPLHIHGEWGVIGTKKGKIRWFGHNPGHSITIKPQKGDRYVLHSHPPFNEPFASSASVGDHRGAAYSYENYKAKEYFTNGKDVLHIHPTSMELIKLIPDPEVEEELGKFPEAFRLPDPQPPYPFSNHEAPAALNKEWEPPAGWRPWPNYPRTEFFKKKEMPPADPKPPEDTPSAQADPRPDLPVNPLGTPSATGPIEPPPTLARRSKPPKNTNRPRVRFAEGA
jgi:hypothetical protein